MLCPKLDSSSALACPVLGGRITSLVPGAFLLLIHPACCFSFSKLCCTLYWRLAYDPYRMCSDMVASPSWIWEPTYFSWCMFLLMLGPLEMYSLCDHFFSFPVVNGKKLLWLTQLINVHLGEAGLGNGVVVGQSTRRQRQRLRARLKCDGWCYNAQLWKY